MMLEDSSRLIFGEAVRPQLATIERAELVGTSTSNSRRPANRLRTGGYAPSQPDTRPHPKAPKKLKWEVGTIRSLDIRSSSRPCPARTTGSCRRLALRVRRRT